MPQEPIGEVLTSQKSEKNPFKRANAWWHRRKRYQKALLILGTVILTVAELAAIWIFAPLELHYKLFASAALLFALNIAVFSLVFWKKRVLQAVLMSFISLLLCAVMVFSAAVWPSLVKKIYNYDDEFTEDREELAAVPIIDNKITNIALFGIDTRNINSFSGNSDSIMILSINSGTNAVKLVSVMRDSLVPIERNGNVIYSKINSAYARGGAELAVRTLNSCFGLDITEYATVNFFGMAKIIDALGGIDIELTAAEAVPVSPGNYGHLNGNISEICSITGEDPTPHYITSAGKHHVNGIQAVAYSRIRYVSNIWGTSNDYGRTDRQRYVMEQLYNKALTMNTAQFPALAKSLIPYTITSLSVDEVLDLALVAVSGTPSFAQERLPKNDYLMRAPAGGFGSVVYYDLEFASRLIHAFIYDGVSFDDYVVTNGISKNNWYANR